ncbi:MAG TPA: hypothetical protein VM754_05925, partial [Actinomycetota bacterium]|nr:hypothetical protein [Actinomycetota bacterium]
MMGLGGRRAAVWIAGILIAVTAPLALVFAAVTEQPPPSVSSASRQVSSLQALSAGTASVLA